MGDVPHCLRNSFMLAFRAQAQNHFQTRTGTHRPYWAESLKGIQRIALLQPFECNAVHHAQGMRGGFKGQPFLAATCFRGVKWLSGKPFGMETPTQGLLPAASKETQDLSSTPWSLEEEETNVQLDFLHVGLKPDTLSILCYDSYGRENYFRTEASSNLEAEQSLAPESKYFPWFLGGVVGGSWDEELQFLLLLHACWVSPQKNRDTGSKIDALISPTTNM